MAALREDVPAAAGGALRPCPATSHHRRHAACVLGEDGQFHAQDEAVDLSGTPVEAWVALGFFWLLGAVVFYQFFTRYVMNDSAAWTEEIARYLLIATVFTGATIGAIKNNHIQVDFFYRFMPKPMARMPRRGRHPAHRLLRRRRGADGADDAEAGQQLAHDHDRPAHELGVRRLPAGLRDDGDPFRLMARRNWKRGYTVLERPRPTMTDN